MKGAASPGRERGHTVEAAFTPASKLQATPDNGLRSGYGDKTMGNSPVMLLLRFARHWMSPTALVSEMRQAHTEPKVNSGTAADGDGKIVMA